MVVVLLLFMSLLLVEVSEIMMMIDRFFVASLSLSRFFSCYPCSNCHRSCRVFELFSVILKKYKTFSVLIYSYINTRGNWKNEKLCENTTPAGRSVFT